MTFLDDTPAEFDRHDMEADAELDRRAEVEYDEPDNCGHRRCRDCGARLFPHPYATFADGRRVPTCPRHGPRDSLSAATIDDYEFNLECLIAREVNRTFDAAPGKGKR